MGRQLLVLWSRATVCGGLSFGARVGGRRVSTEFDGGPGEAGEWKQPAGLERRASVGGEQLDSCGTIAAEGILLY